MRLSAAVLTAAAFTGLTGALMPIVKADPIPGLNHHAVAGQTCSNTKTFPFGQDSAGNFLICASTMHGGVWRPSVPIVGVRQDGASCAEPVLLHNVGAQSPDGRPLVCDEARATWVPN